LYREGVDDRSDADAFLQTEIIFYAWWAWLIVSKDPKQSSKAKQITDNIEPV